MKEIKLVCLITGKKKNGSGSWFKAVLMGHRDDGSLTTGDFFLRSDVGEKMLSEGLTEDAIVNVSFELDEYMRPQISKITRAVTNLEMKKI